MEYYGMGTGFSSNTLAPLLSIIPPVIRTYLFIYPRRYKF